ncbi:MAG: hypothetical protein IAE85_17660 [Anaerolinea sp.]|nr:hypothetical protein [Anaerolinea sp.]HRI56127.1 hypothetical protein [Anaerolineae bacterium]
MSTQNVTLQLPDGLLQRARQAAATLQRPLEDVLTATLAAGLPDVQDAPADMRVELARMTWLNDTDLWIVARSVMLPKDQEQLRYLSELQSQRTLTEDEETRLRALRRVYGEVTLRKARAYALLSLRGGRPLLAEN